jgi:hypothetical protein
MARRSLRTSAELPSRQKPTRTPASSRSSARNSAKQPAPKSTPTKSRYFKKSQKEEERDASEEQDESSAAEPEDSGYEDEPISNASDSEDDDGGDEISSEEDTKSKKRKRAKKPEPKTSQPAGKRAKGQELWREGVSTGLEPGVQVVIPKPKPREAGKTPYKKDTIHPNTLLFLGDLKENNDREWLKSKSPYWSCPLRFCLMYWHFGHIFHGRFNRTALDEATCYSLPYKFLWERSEYLRLGDRNGSRMNEKRSIWRATAIKFGRPRADLSSA